MCGNYFNAEVDSVLYDCRTYYDANVDWSTSDDPGPVDGPVGGTDPKDRTCDDCKHACADPFSPLCAWCQIHCD